MSHEMPGLYPLCFDPIYKSKVWGGRRMEKLGRTLPDGDIGESWELADLAETSVSGGGGGAERSIITNGPLAGKTLHAAISEFGSALMGRLNPNDFGNFPLLVKFLDANENLSVQVHPSAQYAAEHDDAHLKSEAWYIIDAEPGAVIYKGMKEGTDAEAFRAAIESGDEQRVVDMMVTVPVKAGDCHYLPSGTCHALGSGILVAEVQTPSDTTFRVYDWGRTGRELHIDQAMQCITFHPAKVDFYERRNHIAGVFTTVSSLVECEYFRIERVRMSESYRQEIPYDQPTIWMVIEGRGRVTMDKKSSILDTVEFKKGQTLLLPASMKDAHIELMEDTVWLEVTFPQAQSQLIA